MSSSTSRNLFVAGKGSRPRPCQITDQEKDLRYKLCFGLITEKEFNKQMSKLQSDVEQLDLFIDSGK